MMPLTTLRGKWKSEIFGFFFFFETEPQKSRIRETLNLSTDADHRTNIFFGGGDGKKK